jgi:ABC-type glycerol-3-phosphate transport system substrate-binding protein
MASTRFSEGRNLTRRQFLKIAGIFGATVSSSSLLAACGSDEGPGGGFEGVTLRLAVEVGPALGNPIKPYVKEWEQQTGANVEFVEVPFAEIFPKLMSAFQARADEYDVVIILPTWLGDMAGRDFSSRWTIASKAMNASPGTTSCHAART